MLNRLFFVNCLIVQLFHCLVFHRTIIVSICLLHPILFSASKFICLIHWKSVHSHIFVHSLCKLIEQWPQKKRPQISKYRDSDKKSAFVSHSGNISICLPVSPVPWARSEQNEIRSGKNCIHVVFTVKLATVQCYSEPNRYEWKKEKKTKPIQYSIDGMDLANNSKYNQRNFVSWKWNSRKIKI